MGIQVVFFDMGGTIEKMWATRELRLQATPELREHLRAAGIDLHLDDEKLCELVMAGWNRYHVCTLQSGDELPPQTVWSQYILAGYPVNQTKLAAAAQDLMFFLETRYYQREMRPEMPEVLAAVKKMGLKIGLISNVCSKNQVPFNLKQYGIYKYFKPIVLSSEYGRRKPDPAIFHYAARLADVPTGECVYVGDRIARDILGAKRAGFKLAIQIRHDYDHGEDDSGAEPDALINNMMELIPLLESAMTVPQPANQEKRVRALLFDAGDILYFRPTRGQYLKNFLKEQGLAEKELPAAARNSLKHQAYHGQITQDQHREALLRLYGLSDPALIECGKQLMDMDDNDIEVFPGVPETLKQLKEKGYLLAIVTDTANPLHVKLAWFERGGFGDVWDSIISSQEVGVQKPHPRIYQAALRQLGVTVEEAAFVGHSPEELDGASALGLKTIAFNYGETAKADYYVDKFKDLLTVPPLCTNGKK